MISWLKRLGRRVKAFFRFGPKDADDQRERIPLRKRITKRKMVQGLYFTSTALFTGFSLWYFLPTWLAGVIMGTVMIHEFGHYFAASWAGRDAWLPFFIPIPFFGVLGATRVRGTGSGRFWESDAKIALAGPSVAAMFVGGLMIAFGISGFWPGFWSGFWMMIFQIYSGILGGDGRRYRMARREHALQVAGLAPAFA